MSSVFIDEGLEGKLWIVYSNFTTGKRTDVISDVLFLIVEHKNLFCMLLGVHFLKIMK